MADRPVRTGFRTTNSDEARAAMDEMFGWGLRVESLRREQFRMSASSVHAGDVAWSDFQLTATLRFHVDDPDHLMVSQVRSGTTERFDGSGNFGRGDLFLGSVPGRVEETRGTDLWSRAVQLPIGLVKEVARTQPDQPVDDLRFLSRRPVNGAAQRWNAVSTAFQMLVADPDRATAPLVIGPAVRLLAATALDTFPTSLAEQSATVYARDAGPGTLQRAIAFIDANAGLDITLEDIARSAYVSKRAIQKAFRRHLNTTPLAYVRQVRLSHAHVDLLDAPAGGGVTVTRIALRWGFSTPGRFAKAYHAAYGETPSETLQR